MDVVVSRSLRQDGWKVTRDGVLLDSFGTREQALGFARRHAAEVSATTKQRVRVFVSVDDNLEPDSRYHGGAWGNGWGGAETA